MITLEFLITSLIVVLIPGTGVIFSVSTGLIQGRTASVFAAIGCTLGIVPHLLATVFGLAALMHTSALAFEALKVAGVAYLLYLAWATWRDKAAFALDTTPTRGSALNIVVKAVLLNLLNPKLTIFFLAFLPQFVAAKKEKKIRIWSAGCSSGEEPYTILMFLQHHLSDFEEWDIKILATDISSKVLSHAMRGEYDAKQVDPLSREIVLRSFEKVRAGDETRYRVRPHLREKVMFRL